MSTTEIGLTEAARILGLQETTVQNWASRGWLPAHREGDRISFDRAQLEAWAQRNRNRASGDSQPRSLDRDGLSMHAALLRGGVHYDLPGESRDQVLGAVAELSGVPVGVTRPLLRDLLIEREQLASTGVGHGVAIPHPRNPMLVHVDAPVVLLCFLRRAIDFRAIDGEPVRVLFSLLSPSTRVHLRLLARLAWLLRDEGMAHLLGEKAPASTILDRVQFLESHV
jgi:PTS system nitrogen regulatory IIA component